MGQIISARMEKENERLEVDFAPYIQHAQYGPQSVAVPGTRRANRSHIYRMSKVSEKDLDEMTKDHCDSTCLKIVHNLCKKRGERFCLAYRVMTDIKRSVVKDEHGKAKTMETYVFDPQRRSMTYTDFWSNCVAIGRGLRELGLQPHNRVAIYAETCWQWLATLYGCWSQGFVVATVYSNLGNEALIYALHEVACSAVICDVSNVNKMSELVRSNKLPPLKIIYLDLLPRKTEDENRDEEVRTAVAPSDVAQPELFAWQDVLCKGKMSHIPYHVPSRAELDEIALIMYTSGTTGDPKGVVHTHGSLRAGVRALSDRVEDMLGPMKSEEWYCSYLPLAHIMEFGVTSVMMIRGVIIGYGSSRTLMDNFAIPHGDLAEYRPVLFAAVPRVFESMKRAVESRLPKPGTLRRRIFDNAYKARLRALHEGKDTPYYNTRVFGGPRRIMGGRLYGMISGGGPLSPSTQEFISVVFGIIVQGWGLTETVCCGAIQRTGSLEYDSVGQIVKGAEIQLLDTEEFRHTDKPEPRGEILIRGPFMFKEYYQQPKATAEVLDKDGWFHTGDVGTMTVAGTLHIVGRVKSLAKNGNGEYLPLERLESLYGTNEVVTANGVIVLVHPHRRYIALIGTTKQELVEKFKQKHKLSGNYPYILNDEKFKMEVLRSMQETAKAASRPKAEIVQAVQLVADDWNADNGLLTAAMKLKRSSVEQKYKDMIETLFADDS